MRGPTTHPKLACHANKHQFLGMGPRGARGGSLGKELLDEGVSADCHQLLQAGMEGIIILVQKSKLRGIDHYDVMGGKGEHQRRLTGNEMVDYH